MKRIPFLLLLVIIFLAACGGGTQKETKSEEIEEAAGQEAMEPEVPDSISLVIEGDDNIQFNLDEVTVTTGQIITLTLKHVGTMPKESMGHNWVLLKPGTDLATFAIAAQTAVDNEYIPQDKTDQIVAFTDLIGGGQQTSVTFEAPKPGYYKFICSFPGHWATMQGSFVVRPA